MDSPTVQQFLADDFSICTADFQSAMFVNQRVKNATTFADFPKEPYRGMLKGLVH